MRFISLILLVLLLAGPVLAQDATNPKFVANYNVTGLHGLFDHTKSVTDTPMLSMFQVTATSDCTFNFVGFNSSTGGFPLLCPKWGAAVADSVLTLSSGSTEFYSFSKPYPSYLRILTGSAIVKGQ